MKIFYTLAPLLVAGVSQAQHIRFKETGQVETNASVLDRSTSYAVKDSALIQRSTKEMGRASKELAKRFKKTAARLRDTKLEEHAYYQWLWGEKTPTELARQLDSMGEALEKVVDSTTANKHTSLVLVGYTRKLSNQDSLAVLDTTLARCFSKDTILYRITSKSVANEQILTVRTKSAIDDLVLTYFSNLDKLSARKPYDTLSRQGMEHLVAVARKQQVSNRTLLQEVENKRNDVTLALLNKLAKAHTQVEDLGLIQLLKTPWCQRWLWYTGGALRLNPLSFTDEALLRTRPTDDTTKARYLRRYTEHTLRQRLTARKDFNIPSYVADIKFLGKDKYAFIDSAAYKQAVARNKTRAQEFQTSARVLNKVHIPYRQPDLEYLSFTSTSRDELAKVNKLGPFTTDTRVVVSVHNMERKHTLKLLPTQAVLITDQSETQRILNEVSAGLPDVVPSLITGALSLGKDLNNRYLLHNTPIRLQIPNTTISQESGKPKSFDYAYRRVSKNIDFFWPTIEKVVSEGLKMSLADSSYTKILATLPSSAQLFQQAQWDSVRREYDQRVRKYYNQGLTQHEYYQIVQEIGNKYFKLYLSQKITPDLVNLLRKDTVFLNASIRLADTASLPPRKVVPQLNSDPEWHTQRAITSLSDSTKSYVYVLQDVPPKGSTSEPVSFASFSYKTGKRHIVQFSAGLAYSFRPVRTPELNTTGGQLTYSTTDTRFRVFAGINVYPFRKGVFLQDKNFLGLRPGKRRITDWALWSRVNVQLAVGIPRPLDNVYLGLGYDLGPGIRINSGVHLHGYTAYEVANNRVLTQGTTYDAVPYLAVGIDPVTFVKSLVFFK